MLHRVKLQITGMTIADSSLLHKYGELLFEELDTPGFKLDAFIFYLKRQVLKGEAVVYIARDMEGKEVGAIAGRLCYDHFRDCQYLDIIFQYVVNDYRGTDAVKQLDDAVTEWGKDNKAAYIVTGFIYGCQDLGPLLGWMGYVPDSVVYRRDL